MAKRKPKVFMVPHIAAPKILPGQRCTCIGEGHAGDHEFDHHLSADYDRLHRESKPMPTRCSYVEPTEEERQEETRKRMLENERKRIIDNAQRAINCMRGFLDNAQRRVDDVVTQPNRLNLDGEPLYFLGLPEQVLHEFGWGMANSTTSIQTAMRAVVDYMRLERMKA